MIKLSHLELQNFLSHLSTSLNLDKYDGLVLIEGQTAEGHYSSNGSGKSSLLEGIVYALTGDTLRGVSVNDVINRNVKKDTKVSLNFQKGQDQFQVSRYRKDHVYGDSLVLHKNGEDISKRVNKETQKSLEDILGISYKVLVSTVLLGEGLSSRFTQLSDPEKKALIESTLNLSYDMSKIREKANNELKRLRLEAATIKGEITTLESLIDTDIDLLQDAIYDERQCLDIYKKTIAELEEKYDFVVKESYAINPKINLLRETLHKSEVLAKQYTDLMQSNGQYQAERDSITSTQTPICSMCHQPLSSHESLSSVLETYNQKIKENIETMQTISDQLSHLPDQPTLRLKLDTLTREYDEKITTSRTLLQEINEYQVKIAKSEKEIETSESMIRDSMDSQSKLAERKQKESELLLDIERYEYFYTLFSPTGIVVNILSDAIEYINTRLAKYSGVLLEKDYQLSFVKGKISLIDNKGSSYQSLSNGEKRRLDISIQFALHDYVHTYCGMKLDTVFIDEILDTLDDVGVENIIDVLRMKLDYCQLKSIYVITHNSSLKSKFDQVVTVYKGMDGNSKLI